MHAHSTAGGPATVDFVPGAGVPDVPVSVDTPGDLMTVGEAGEPVVPVWGPGAATGARPGFVVAGAGPGARASSF
jgi:hypothetical protein